MSQERPAEFVQSLERGLAVIRAFSAENPRQTLSEVARHTDMTRATARRFLLTLQALGYVSTDGKTFALRPSVLQLGYAYLSSFSVAEVAQDHLEALADELHESCSASVLDGEDVVYVARSSTNRIMTIGLSVGARLPAYCTSMGRVLLAGLDEPELDHYLQTADLQARTDRTITDRGRLRAEIDVVRTQGWCLIDQELEDGVRSVAAPVHDGSGRVVAAINTSAHAARVTLDTLRTVFLPALRTCGQRIDQDLAGRRH
ncbi:MAG: IclR family transcriptional regulator [Actinomycetales bacterium]|nr:IclR family transcriptional regulator [Actinomycetales bacterium]